jgi:DNA-binding transcriptional MerR regulator
VDRTPAGYRRYSEHDVQLLRFIRQARDLGLSLADIRTVIELRRGGTPPGDEVTALLEDHVHAIDRRISNLQALRLAMSDVLQAATTRADQGRPVQLCRIIDTG